MTRDVQISPFPSKIVKSVQRLRGLLEPLNRREQAFSRREGLSTGWLVALFFVACLLISSRSPTLFQHPQFYAEDGAVWYAEAYNTGWLHSLTLPDGGYLNTVQRLGAGPALLVPFGQAPLVMMILGLLIQGLPVPILLSGRCRDWGSLSLRAMFAFIYIALPNSNEIQVVLTNSQWHLALATALLAFASAPRGWIGRVVDISVFLVAGFSGPFCIILLPLLLIFWWVRRQSWSLAGIAVMASGTLTQLVLLHWHHGDRIQKPLGATAGLFVRMFGGDILLAGMLGSHPWSTWLPLPALIAVSLAGLFLCCDCARFAPLPIKLFLIFCILLLPPELKTPLIDGDKPLWQLLVVDTEARYWFFPMIAFLWSAMWCALHAPAKSFRWAGAAVMVILPVGIYSDWRFTDEVNIHFPESVRRFEAAAPGESVTMPVMPKPIVMTLIKK